MADFEAQVNGITNLGIDGSSTDPGQTELTQFLRDGVIDVTSKIVALRPQDIENFQRETSISDSQGVNVGGAKIISVIREAGADGSSDGSTAWEVCRKIPASMQSKVVNVDSLHYASQYHPVYTMNGDKAINVYPTPSSNNGFKIFYVNEEPRDITNNAALTYAHANIKYFPNDKVYLVVIYAAIKSLQASLASASISTFSLTTVPPDTPTVPSFTTPGVSTVTIGSLGTPPTYTAPAVGSATEEITASMDADSSGYGTDADFLNYSKWFSVAGELIEDEEDTELAAVQIQKISTYLQSYSQAMQNQLNIFNDANVEYQSTVQEAIQNAQIAAQEAQQETSLLLQKEQQEYASTLQKYTAELQSYQGEVAAEIQTYQQELAEKNAEYQWKTARLQDLKQEYTQAFAIMAPPPPQQQQERQRAR
jgi:hypothetical protein